MLWLTLSNYLFDHGSEKFQSWCFDPLSNHTTIWFCINIRIINCAKSYLLKALWVKYVQRCRNNQSVCRFALPWKTTTEKHWASTSLRLCICMSLEDKHVKQTFHPHQNLKCLTISHCFWLNETEYNCHANLLYHSTLNLRRMYFYTHDTFKWVPVRIRICVCIPSAFAAGCFFRSKRVPVSSVVLQLGAGTDTHLLPPQLPHTKCIAQYL